MALFKMISALAGNHFINRMKQILRKIDYFMVCIEEITPGWVIEYT